jgi:hypothetical protein
MDCVGRAGVIDQDDLQTKGIIRFIIATILGLNISNLPHCLF